MISVCIPIFNDRVTELVQSVRTQCESCAVEYEVVLLDDCSGDTAVVAENRELARLPKVYYYENEQNMGLSRARNKLGQLARYPYLLFIDSDARIVRRDFIARYAKFCYPGAVSFGGCVYADICPDKRFILRWKYGKYREEGVGRYYSCFNFLIDKDVLLKYPFYEGFSRYGYEDTLLGITLRQNGVEPCFIDNPLLHTGLITADAFLAKIGASIGNLAVINSQFIPAGTRPPVRLLRAYRWVESLHAKGFASFAFRRLKKLLISNLKSKKPLLIVLDFYKLGSLCSR
jgi:glycosyltransferase involved in cell wall biosynthesis